MAKIGLTEAVKLTGKDRRTIQRAIKSGKLSASKSSTGKTEIDTAELDRVYKITTLPMANAIPNSMTMSQRAAGDEIALKEGLSHGAYGMPMANAMLNDTAMSQYAIGEKDKIIALLEDKIKGLHDKVDSLEKDKVYFQNLIEDDRKRFDRMLPVPIDEASTAKTKQGGFFKKIFNRK